MDRLVTHPMTEKDLAAALERGRQLRSDALRQMGRMVWQAVTAPPRWLRHHV